jgi:photosystem II stability/assembly factor-like uncharacterized protein
MHIRHLAAAIGLSLATLHAQTPTPSLPALESIPPSIPYVYKNVVIRAGGFVSGLIFSPAQKDLVYARTDVGGAYRSDDGGNLWIPITDQFGPRDSTYTGIESIATDPSNPNNLYIAAGMYTNQWGGPSAIFRSIDKGRTLLKSPMPFKMGGNDDGRGVGERLAVDPNLGSTLYFGSRLAGLWRSTDAGVSWSHVDSFPAPAHLTGPGEKTGITFILFDPSSSSKGSPTKTIYAGVAQAGISLYRSTDAGQTWHLIPNSPKDLFPTHAVLVPGKTLYLTFDNNPGPNGMTAGQVLRYSVADSKFPEGQFKDISPALPTTTPGNHKFGYGGLALDAQHPDTLMVTTQDRWYPKDAIFRSTDGGDKWTEIGPDAVYSVPSVPWVYWHKAQIGGTGWMQTIAIDPFHSDKVMYTTGEGIYGSADITNADSHKPTHWGFPDVGLEELVVADVISPPSGAPLLSTVWDLDGFRHEDLNHSPANGIFTDPQLTTGRSIDFAANDPNILVRVGWSDNKIVRGGYSHDNGITWKPFASEPPSSHRGGGRVAISADARTIAWSPDDGVPYVSTNWGGTWTQCLGLTDKSRVVADRVDPSRFYSFTGHLFLSTDGARSFAASSAPLTPVSEYAELAPTPGLTGDLWIATGNHLFHTTDSGATFATVQGMTDVRRIGFGKPAPGKTTPAIYLSGVVQNTEGLFRSTDAGQTWLRIDDPVHQFGSKESITGDPRIFGRVYFGTGGRGILYGDPSNKR